VPEADWPQFRDLITASAGALEPSATPEDLIAADVAGSEVRQYFHALVAERRAHPKDDLLSDLIRVEEAGDTLSEAEVIAVAILLFAAGFETTTNLIGNGMGALLRHVALGFAGATRRSDGPRTGRGCGSARGTVHPRRHVPWGSES